MKKVIELPSQEDLLKIFYYDDCLRWKKDIKKARRDVKAGDKVVGYINSGGYSLIWLDGVQYKASRIIYQLFYGNLTTDLVIDHINRNTLDDRIENLRAVTRKINQRNQSKRSNNATGMTGVCVITNKYLKANGTYSEYKLYMAIWLNTEGKQKSKSFSVSKHGEDMAFKLACEYRRAMIESLKDSGEWYDEKHGM